MVPCRVALFPLEEFFYVTLRFFLGTLSTQSIHRSAPTRLPPDLALSSILPFRRAPLFLCRCVPFSLLFSFRALKKIPPRQPPPNLVRPSNPTPPFEARVVEPTDQTNHSQVSASASVRVVSISISISTQPSPYARLVSPVSPGLVLSSPGLWGLPRLAAVACIPAPTSIVYSLPLHLPLRSPELDPVTSTTFPRHRQRIVGHLWSCVLGSNKQKEFGIPARG